MIIAFVCIFILFVIKLPVEEMIQPKTGGGLPVTFWTTQSFPPVFTIAVMPFAMSKEKFLSV